MVFTALNQSDIVSISNVPVVAPAFSSGINNPAATTFTTSSFATGVLSYKLSGSSKTEFTVAIGSQATEGWFSGSSEATSIYKQAILKYGDNKVEDSLKFVRGNVPDTYGYFPDIVIINFNKSNIKDALRAGTWRLPLSGSSSPVLSIDKQYTLADESATATAATAFANNYPSKYWDIFPVNRASGSLTEIGNGLYTEWMGTMFPQAGVLILNLRKLGLAHKATVDLQLQEFHNAFKGSGATLLFENLEKVKTNVYFVRVPHDAYNGTENISYYTNKNYQSGPLFNEWVSYPVTYISGIGLYNEDGELLAMAKTSAPIRKDTESECLFQIKLNF